MLIDKVISNIYPIYEASDPGIDHAVEGLAQQLDRIYNQGGKWKISGINLTMGEVAELYDIYKNIVHDHVDINKITTISQNVKDSLIALGFNVKPQGVGWALTESDDVEDDLSDYLQKRGTYAVSAFTNDYMEPVGTDKTFTDPGKAIEYWFKLNQKYPTCAMIVGYVSDEQKLRDWVINNKQLVSDWAEKYHCCYKTDYLLDACEKPVRQRNDKYPDQMFPFCLG